ncbi:hypothetical protein MACH09_15090 [Vibrio sp. MACH09]|uniref:hypothetical protein n=1 Tax=unclassified Vibrio TaxID=2614977 RepID=UPI001493A5EF|nr:MULTISPECIES: hypothetical protein [unclassified Vibrio]GLO61001.1 hypothetical protein MACH09_15090 [Vibrio sp. MACH09]
MTRMIAIAAFIALSVFLIRYGTNKNVQQSVTLAFICGFAAYTIILVVSELLH